MGKNEVLVLEDGSLNPAAVHTGNMIADGIVRDVIKKANNNHLDLDRNGHDDLKEWVKRLMKLAPYIVKAAPAVLAFAKTIDWGAVREWMQQFIKAAQIAEAQHHQNDIAAIATVASKEIA